MNLGCYLNGEADAGQFTAGTDSRFDAVRALEQWLATEREYSLDVQDSGFDDPLVAFLLGEMPGHCEYFATSMVVLARSLDIPSRLVTGYLRGEKNRFSRTYLVRRSDAHAWVEVYFPGHGWVAFDPTPSAGRTTGTDVGLADLISDLHLTIRRWWDSRRTSRRRSS